MSDSQTRPALTRRQQIYGFALIALNGLVIAACATALLDVSAQTQAVVVIAVPAAAVAVSLIVLWLWRRYVERDTTRET